MSWQPLIPTYLLDSLLGCSPGMFGANCSQPCQCGSGERCHPETGACVCPPGHSGAPCRMGEFLSRSLSSSGNQDMGLCQDLGPSSRGPPMHVPQDYYQSQDTVLNDCPTH